ncbi:CLUMA_CG005374, isoform A [Clunio marinus]|uniref:CLUMA_CG005374, isoform A n=1 Tax=Clunio marinus TaxID=568069 RepID=A0A1J1HW09_9DIPT|nr:CLUMA_CG005374, isoform A [Clunio marinus]
MNLFLYDDVRIKVVVDVVQEEGVRRSYASINVKLFHNQYFMLALPLSLFFGLRFVLSSEMITTSITQAYFMMERQTEIVKVQNDC